MANSWWVCWDWRGGSNPEHRFSFRTFWRQLRFGDFDISEMSFSSLIKTISQGDDRWVGLPIFMTRRFFHTEMISRTDRGIETPADLKGKRVGVPGINRPLHFGPAGHFNMNLVWRLAICNSGWSVYRIIAMLEQPILSRRKALSLIKSPWKEYWLHDGSGRIGCGSLLHLG